MDKEKYIKEIYGKKNKEIVRKFVSHLEVEGLSESRIKWYLIMFVKFTDFIKKDLDKVNKEDVESYLAYLKNKGYEEWSISTNLSLLKRFYK